MEKKRLVEFLNIDPPPKDPMVSNNIPKAKQTDSHASLLKREHEEEEEEEEEEDGDDDDHGGIGVTSGRRYSRFTACFRGFGARKQNLGIARRTTSMRNEEKSSRGGGGGNSSRRERKAFSMRELSMASVREKYRKVDHQWDYDPEDEISLFAVENGKMETSTQGFMKAPETDKKTKAKIFESCKRFFGF